MSRLDDPSAIAAADPKGMLAAVESSAEQWSEAIERSLLADLPEEGGVEAVCVCGMGGSGVAGDVLAAVAAPAGSVPVVVNKGYALPAFAGESTLVICASYSGNTEETLACFDEAIARRARVVCVTTGGALAERADRHGIPRVAPVERLQPRAALASLAVPVLVACERAGVLGDLTADLAEARTVLANATERYGRDAAANPAKALAERFASEDAIPLVWGQEGPLAVSALRWRCQMNENAKVPAFSSVLPELDHNELVGYDPGVKALDRVGVVVLRSREENPRIALRVQATLDAMADRVAFVEQVAAEGVSPLGVLMSGAIAGDFTSVYLAIERGVDPTPVSVIESLKGRLA